MTQKIAAEHFFSQLTDRYGSTEVYACTNNRMHRLHLLVFVPFSLCCVFTLNQAWMT